MSHFNAREPREELAGGDSMEYGCFQTLVRIIRSDFTANQPANPVVNTNLAKTTSDRTVPAVNTIIASHTPYKRILSD